MDEIEAHAKKYGYEDTLKTIEKHEDMGPMRRNQKLNRVKDKD